MKYLSLKANNLVYNLLKTDSIICSQVSTIGKNITKQICRSYVQVSQPNIFDRKTKFLQKERAAKHPDVALFDYIKEEVGFRLSDRIFDIKREFTTAADIGCGRGFVSTHVLAETVKHLILCDISPTMLEQAQGSPGLRISKIEMDEENLEFQDNSLDLVVSSLSLHWVNDLSGCFQNVNNSLKADGVFIASMFGGDTLYELRSSLQLAEIERNNGISPHISPFTQIRDIGAILNSTGYSMLTIDIDELVVGYPTMFELMWDLKGMAENNAAFNRPAHLNRDTMFAASAIYNELYGKDNSIPATFQIIYFVAWKPSPNQSKPLARGSGKISLKDLGTINEN